jgi:hypothetical protein
MQNARYFRDRRALCLRIAGGISDPQMVQILRDRAAQYSTLAAEMEMRAADAAAERKEADRFEDSFYFRTIGRKIGEELRSRYDVSEPLPDRLTDLLSELDKDLEEPAPAEGHVPGPGTSGSR